MDAEEQELLAEFLEESMDALDSLDSLFVELERDPSVESIQAIFRPVHSMKGNASYFGMEHLTGLTHELETLLDLCRTEKIRVTPQVVDTLLAGIDELRSMLGRMRMGQGEVGDREALDRMLAGIRNICSTGANISEWSSLMESLTWLKADGGENEERLAVISKVIQSVTMLVGGAQEAAGSQVKENVAEDLAASEERQSEAEKDEPAGEDGPNAWTHPGRRESDKALKRSMRVPEASINEFLELVGELVVIGEMYDHVRQRLIAVDPDSAPGEELSRVNETFLETSLALQKGIMNVRLVPMRATLQKVPRLVRDIAHRTGKKIEVELVGEDEQVDKSHVGILEAPITHMVRNAADHGIESSEERVAAGKSPEGHIKVSVSTTEDQVCLTISDDGGGLDLDRLKEKAVSLGMIRPDEALTQEATKKLLFMSGVSTAEEVTSISGRGVGMDAVRRDIEAAGGRITVSTTKGEGSTFSITLPRTVSTQILEAFVIGVNGAYYVLPLDRIAESYVIRESEILVLPSGLRVIQRHDMIVPMIDLYDVFTLKRSAAIRFESSILVTVESEEGIYALLVDEIIGTQQVVVKNLAVGRIDPNVFIGCAVMGDGQIAMVLDSDRLARLSTFRSEHAELVETKVAGDATRDDRDAEVSSPKDPDAKRPKLDELAPSSA